MPPRVSIITVNYNGSEDTLACLESLQRCTYPDFEVWVVDNGSETGQREKLKQGMKLLPPAFFLLPSATNLGFGGGNNLAIEKVLAEGKSQYVYLLNNDTQVEPDFLTHAVELAESGPPSTPDSRLPTADDRPIGIVNSLCLQFNDRTRVENAGHELLDCGDSTYRGRGSRPEDHPGPVELLGASGAAVLYRVETLRECGTFDASFFLNYEDADLSLRCIMMGWRALLQPKSIVYHRVNASIRKVKDYPFYVRSQYNQFRSYYHNLPTGVLLANLPWVMLRDIGVIALNLIFLRLTILRVFLHARMRMLSNLGSIWRVRRANLTRQRTSSWYFLRRQRSFIGVYARYFYEIIVARRRSVFETRARE